MFPRFTALVLCGLLTGCGGGGGPAPINTGDQMAAMPPPSDVMRAGDKVTIRLSGVPADDYVKEVQIPASGDITVPLLTQSFHAVGRNASDLAAEIAGAYKSEKIFTNPDVTVIPEDRYVNVGGDVRNPSRVLYTSDLTLLGAINGCGGFTEFANRKAVRILRAGQQVMIVDANAAARNPGADPVVYAGDQIYVPRTPF